MHLRTKRTNLGTLTTALALGAALLVPSAPGQAAVDAVPAGSGGRITVRLAPGTYVTADHPRTPARDAAHHDVADHLAGEDGRTPHRSTQH
ncbi:hypothetical protein F0344_28935 [Streptomyces finlayi]|uniref:Uncharacterized protein n=1 Tax=Streptomyces finlayi TaxID=67296 RepID=A0A7G7BRX1_9ACTN|nr:hypothetical protein [Streptomyces finlayi]QNE78086.1 hypothetical protein F0344_28935 [Streptomyces finlayi]